MRTSKIMGVVAAGLFALTLGAQQAEIDGRDHAHPARKDLRSRPFLDEQL